MITYKIVKGKYVFCKNGVYFSLTKEQMEEMKTLFVLIEKESKDTTCIN